MCLYVRFSFCLKLKNNTLKKNIRYYLKKKIINKYNN